MAIDIEYKSVYILIVESILAGPHVLSNRCFECVCGKRIYVLLYSEPPRTDVKAMANVLLLREPSQDSPDRYQTAFSAAGYHPISIPVLKTFHTNLPHLQDIIQEGPKALGYNGVIITSKRSCDSWKEALQLLSKSAPDDTHAIGWCLLSCIVKVKSFKFDSQRDGVRYHSM